MRRDSRLSVALHVLLHMSEAPGTLTSEALAPMLKMNAVVLRRTLGALRDANIVRSEKGHGGGWTLARDLASVTLGEVYAALGTETLFGIGLRDAKTQCPIEQAVNTVVEDAMADARAALVARLGQKSVADVLVGARTKVRHRKVHTHAHL